MIKVVGLARADFATTARSACSRRRNTNPAGRPASSFISVVAINWAGTGIASRAGNLLV
jgi:hypothetical protein